MNKRQGAYVIAGVGLLAAGVIALLATRTAGPVPMPRFTETRSAGPLMEHLITAEELHDSPVYTPHFYPPRVAHGISQVVAYGFAPLHTIPDPQIAALPAEKMW